MRRIEERRRCWCWAESGLARIAWRDDGEHAWGQCLDCRTIVLDGVPPCGSSAIYQGDWYHGKHQLEVGHRPYADRFHHDHALAHERLKKIRRFTHPEDDKVDLLLDWGCSNGAFVVAAKEQGYDAQGYDINEGIVEFARSQCAPAFSRLDDEGLHKKVDILTAHDVLEHYEDPEAGVQQWAERLCEGGLLVVDTPDGGLAPFLGRKYHHMRFDEHIYLFTFGGLARILEESGFDVLEIDRPIVGKLVAYARKL